VTEFASATVSRIADHLLVFTLIAVVTVDALVFFTRPEVALFALKHVQAGRNNRDIAT